MKYEEETKRICSFIQGYVDEAKAKGIVLGFSGGLDSAVVAFLSKKAIGNNNVYCYYLPYTEKADIGKRDENISLAHNYLTSKINIKDSVDAIASTIVVPNKLTIGNIKARVRMTILYAIAQRKGCLVAGTTNRSEWMTGYFTKFGDGGCDIEPILHLYKTEVFELAKHLGIPKEIISKPPSADLWKGQTDEKELGITYKELDRILMFLEKRSPYSVFVPSWMDRKNYELVMNLVSRSEHKRRLPPCLNRE